MKKILTALVSIAIFLLIPTMYKLIVISGVSFFTLMALFLLPFLAAEIEYLQSRRRD